MDRTADVIASGLILCALGLACVALGRYGWQHPDQLVGHISGDDLRERRWRAMRRNSAGVAAVGAFVIAAGIVSLGVGVFS